MADFKEDDQKTFHQEVKKEKIKNFQLFIAKAKENPLCYRPFIVQCAILLFISFTENTFHIPDTWSGYIEDFWLLAVITFLLFITLLTAFELKSEECPCFQVALPNILVQTDLFYSIIVLIGTAYGKYGVMGYFLLIVPHYVIPVIPAFIGLFFVIGCVIDKKREQK